MVADIWMKTSAPLANHSGSGAARELVTANPHLGMLKKKKKKGVGHLLLLHSSLHYFSAKVCRHALVSELKLYTNTLATHGELLPDVRNKPDYK